MKLDFRIDWGYQYLYSRRHYHPVFLWDGHLECDSGTITECYALDYPVIWYGPGHCAHETRLAGPSWKSRTRRGLAGVRIVTETEANARFRLITASGSFSFGADELLREGRCVFPVGPKYLGCHVIVTRTNFLWFRPAPRPGEQAWEADDLPLPCHDWARMRTAWLAPGETLEFEADLPESAADFTEYILHLEAMAAPACTPGCERQVHDLYSLAVLCDDRPVARCAHYFREHDTYMQMLEDVWVRFQASPGRRRLGIRNENPHFPLLFSRLTLRTAGYSHLELSLPSWALTGEPLTGRIFAVKPDSTVVRWPGGSRELVLQKGWNEFPFSISEPLINAEVSTGSTRGIISAVYALEEEKFPVTVGFDLTTVPHDDNGFMDWLLDYTWRTRLGNLVVFRSFRWQAPGNYTPVRIAPESLRRWGEFCRTHHITVEAANQYEDGALIAAAGEALHSVGLHEYPGAVYARDPAEPWSSADMKEAAEHYMAYLKAAVDKTHEIAPRAAFGDASGGHRYCYLAGADFIRTETMVPHTQHICSQARPAAEALGSGEWGVHIAIQHAMQPYFETHLGQYFLSLYQPWMMGASMIYEEDSLFLLFKEERQCWDDRLTKGKRDMTRDFFRFVKTHPRRGRNRRNIAFLEGRYAAPFNGFICDSEQTPDYSVWGLFGNPAPEWGHGQPEKCRQLLDVLMPGANTHPLRQRCDRRRFFFSGTPYGDFDEVPVEVGAEYLQQYKLLLNLGWNTMIREDYDKLCEFVRNGGTLFTGLPQFSTHIRRDFLKNWQELALWNGGDLSELCGVVVGGPGPEYSGQWNAAGRETFPEPQLSSAPNRSVCEDGPCRLAALEPKGAEIVAWDAATGHPLVLRHRLGKGIVYLLAAWAYPGHEALQTLSASWLAHLAEKCRGEYYVEDSSREVFWTSWEEPSGVRYLMLLNTDWTQPGNIKEIRVHTPAFSFDFKVKERKPSIITLLPFAAVVPEPGIHLEVLSYSALQAHLRLHGTVGALTIYKDGGRSDQRDIPLTDRTVQGLILHKD